jgi:hypothetical protein
VPVIVYVGLFLPQIFAARYVESLPWKKGWAIAWGTVQRVTVLLMGIVILTLAGKHPSTALGLFLGVYALLHVLAGMATPGWYDFFAKVTPLHRRGRLAGMRTGFGSLAAFLAGIVLTLFLSSLRFPLNYAVGFFIAFLLQMASVITQIYIVEPEPSRVAEKRPISAYLLRLPEVFRGNKEFRHFMVSAIILVIANMPVGFFTVYALKRFGAGEEVDDDRFGPGGGLDRRPVREQESVDDGRCGDATREFVGPRCADPGLVPARLPLPRHQRGNRDDVPVQYLRGIRPGGTALHLCRAHEHPSGPVLPFGPRRRVDQRSVRVPGPFRGGMLLLCGRTLPPLPVGP